MNRACDMQARSIFIVRNQVTLLSKLDITSNLPFRSVVAEETNTKLSASNSNTFMNDSQTSSKVLSAFMNSLVILPDVSTEGLSLGIPWTATETLILWDQPDY